LTFRQNIARLITGEIHLRAMPGVAVEALEEGLDTPSLRILAGLSEDENEFLIERYLQDTLNELAIKLPDKRKAAIEIGLAIANKILEGKTELFQGVDDIKCKAIDAYSFYEETKHYCYDSIGFEKVYGLFCTIEDLRSAGSTQWQPGKTNEELEKELKEDLLTELKVWAEAMKDSN
jgi:hypothetical protein